MFQLYGFKKTSMDDIANNLGISRASLYSYFKNKDEIFREVAILVHERALLDAQHCLDNHPSAPSLKMRIEKGLIARHAPFFKTATESLHGEEIHDEHHRLCGDVVTDFHRRFQELLAITLKDGVNEGEISPKTAGLSEHAAAELLNLGAKGLKHGAAGAEIFEKRVTRFVNVFFVGIQNS